MLPPSSRIPQLLLLVAVLLYAACLIRAESALAGYPPGAPPTAVPGTNAPATATPTASPTRYPTACVGDDNAEQEFKPSVDAPANQAVTCRYLAESFTIFPRKTTAQVVNETSGETTEVRHDLLAYDASTMQLVRVGESERFVSTQRCFMFGHLYFDSETGASAFDRCCACQQTASFGAVPHLPLQQPAGKCALGQSDNPNFRDALGRTCDYYTADPHRCFLYGNQVNNAFRLPVEQLTSNGIPTRSPTSSSGVT